MLAEVQYRKDVLLRMGLGVGDRILIAHGDSLEFFADLLSVWEIGACAVCIDPSLPVTQTQMLVEYSEAKLVLAGSGTNLFPSPRVPIVELQHERTGNSKNLASIKNEPTRQDEALILFTSGTTGVPKGVVLSFGALRSRLDLNLKYIDPSEITNVLCPLPTHFGHGLIGNCLTFLQAGCRVILAPNPDATFLFDFGRTLDSYKVSFLSSVPTLWKIVVETASEPIATSLKRIHIGSAPLSERLWRDVIRWSGTSDVVNMYGMTETANWVAGASAATYSPRDGLVGKLWGGETGLLVRGEEITHTGEGELLIQTPSFMSGYLKRTDLTESVLCGHWFRTGDWGSIDDDGVITLTGRLKFEINRAGLKVQPEDINRVLHKHPSITEAYAFGLPDALVGEIVAVAVVPSAGQSIDAQGLKSWCRSFLVKEKIPEKWFPVVEIPKTDRGKVDRDRLIGECLNRNLGAD